MRDVTLVLDCSALLLGRNPQGQLYCLEEVVPHCVAGGLSFPGVGGAPRLGVSGACPFTPILLHLQPIPSALELFELLPVFTVNEDVGKCWDIMDPLKERR